MADRLQLETDVVVIYHKNCLDGIGAAWCAWNHYKGKVDMVPCQYGDNFAEMFGPNFEELVGKVVYCLDFSFDMATTVGLMNICNLVVLDHHESAWKNLKQIATPTIAYHMAAGWLNQVEEERPKSVIIVDQSYSGAVLAWMYFNSTSVKVPDQLLYIQDRDLWQWKLGNTRDWTAGAFSYEFTAENFDELIRSDICEVIDGGKAVTRHSSKTVKSLAKQARRFQIAGYDVPIVNCNSVYASDLGHLLGQGEKFSITYVDGKDGRIFSIRSADPTFDATYIAESFGGGGHKGACGFRLSFDDDQFHHSHLYLDLPNKER